MGGMHGGRPHGRPGGWAALGVQQLAWKISAIKECAVDRGSIVLAAAGLVGKGSSRARCSSRAPEPAAPPARPSALHCNQSTPVRRRDGDADGDVRQHIARQSTLRKGFGLPGRESGGHPAEIPALHRASLTPHRSLPRLFRSRPARRDSCRLQGRQARPPARPPAPAAARQRERCEGEGAWPPHLRSACNEQVLLPLLRSAGPGGWARGCQTASIHTWPACRGTRRRHGAPAGAEAAGSRAA